MNQHQNSDIFHRFRPKQNQQHPHQILTPDLLCYGFCLLLFARGLGIYTCTYVWPCIPCMANDGDNTYYTCMYIYIYISKIYIKTIYIYSIYDSPTAGLTVTVSTFTPHFGPDWWDDVFVPFGPASSGPLERCANFFSGSSHDTHFPCFKYIEKDVNHTQRPYK